MYGTDEKELTGIARSKKLNRDTSALLKFDMTNLDILDKAVKEKIRVQLWRSRNDARRWARNTEITFEFHGAEFSVRTDNEGLKELGQALIDFSRLNS